MTTHTSLKKTLKTYEWVIHGFTEILKLYNDISERKSLQSPYFFLSRTDQNNFELTLTFNETTSDLAEWLSLYLSYGEVVILERVHFQLYILDVNKVKQNMCYRKKILNQTILLEWQKFCKKKKLLQKAKELLPYKTLTIGCCIVAYNDIVNVSIIPDPNLKSFIQDQFLELLENEDESDFVFEVGDIEFKVHKLIMKTRSPVFKAMLESKMKENNIGRAIIADINPVIFEIMLKFIYTGRLKESLTEENLFELLAAADKYQLNDLKNNCENFLFKHICAHNALEILSFAEIHNAIDLAKNVENFIKANKQYILDNIDCNYFDNNGRHAKIFLF